MDVAYLLIFAHEEESAMLQDFVLKSPQSRLTTAAETAWLTPGFFGQIAQLK